MSIEKPAQDILQPGVPAGAVSYCSGPTGDCWWLKEVREINGRMIPDDEVSYLRIGDTGGTFVADVRPHEVEKVAEAWLKKVVALYGMDAIMAIVENDPLGEQLEDSVYELMAEDVKRSDARLNRPSWRDRLPTPANA